MTYQEYKDAKQAEFNDLPIFYAFSNKQMIEALQERGIMRKGNNNLEKRHLEQIYSLGYGGYYLRKDADIIRTYFSKKDTLPELMQNYDFALDAIYYEMCNHEYAINWQADWDVCRCFGNVEYNDSDSELQSYMDALGWNETTRRAYLDARRKYFKAAYENEWF